jgi:hypothetical protein
MAIELLPDLQSKCIALTTGLGEVCIELPGGVKLCASASVEFGDPNAIIREILAQANTALAPLTPFFNMIDVFKAVMDCITAIPDSILTLNPQPIVECITNLTKAVDKLLALIPALSIPILAKSLLDAIILGLQGIRSKLLTMIRQMEKILASATRAAETGNFQLQLVVDCANGNMDAQLENMNASMAPLNRLIGILNVLLELAGLPCVPALGTFAEVSEAILAPLDAAIELLEQIKAAIPSLDLVLPALPPAGECP